MYNWPDVAERTTAVYDKVMSACSSNDTLLQRLRRYQSIGIWAGPVFCCIIVLLHWFWRFLESQQPAAEVEPAYDWPNISKMLDQNFKHQQPVEGQHFVQGKRRARQRQPQQP